MPFMAVPARVRDQSVHVNAVLNARDLGLHLPRGVFRDVGVVELQRRFIQPHQRRAECDETEGGASGETSMSPRLRSISSSSFSVTDWESTAASSSPSKVTMDRRGWFAARAAP